MWDHLARDPPRPVVVAEERSGTLGGGLDVVAVGGEAAPTPQAHRTAPYRPRYSLDQRTAGQYRWRADAGTPVAECIRKSGPHSLPGAGQGRRLVPFGCGSAVDLLGWSASRTVGPP